MPPDVLILTSAVNNLTRFAEKLLRRGFYLSINAMRNCWQVLGVQPTGDLEAVKRAWRSLVRQWHPDTVSDPELKRTHTARCIEINLAYGTAIRIASRIPVRTEPEPSKGTTDAALVSIRLPAMLDADVILSVSLLALIFIVASKTILSVAIGLIVVCALAVVSFLVLRLPYLFIAKLLFR